MTVHHFIKGILLFISLFGIVFLGIGSWKGWTAFRFAQHADKAVGTFKGYHTVYHEITTTDSFDHPSQSYAEEALPMYTYTDAHGVLHDVTGTEGHFFKHLTFGDKIKVLVTPDGSAAPRLGDILSLYGNAFLLCIVGLFCLILVRHGMKAADRYLGPHAQPSYGTSLGLRSLLQQLGQSRLPVGDMAVYLGGFVLIGGTVAAFAVHITFKRQDPALINALQQKEYARALSLVAQGRGLDAKTEEGEPPLIMALKANQPDLARAILKCWFVSANVDSADKRSSAQLAAANGDIKTLALLIQKGAPPFGLEPSLIHALIVKGDAATLKLIFDNGYNLYQTYNQLSFGDYAVIQGQAEIVRMIQAHNGLFQAPPTFIALALNDPIALKAALNRPNAAKFRFCGYSLEEFAKKIDRQTLLKEVP